jgi:hypothetical protein
MALNMRRRRFVMRLTIALCAWAGGAPPSAQADRVVLGSGAVIEGQADVQADKVVVRLESGAITLPRASVLRVERDRPPADVLAERRKKLGTGDVAGRLSLARYAAEHQLPNTERELLLEVLALQPDQPEAHARLGHVRTEHGFVDGAELARHRREEREADNRSAREARERAELTLERARLERDRAALMLEAEQRRSEERTRPAYTSYPSVLVTGGYPAAYPWRAPQRAPHVTPAQPAPFDINGVRSPHDMSFSLPGVRDPRSYYGR